jgi:hypothetical protein
MIAASVPQKPIERDINHTVKVLAGEYAEGTRLRRKFASTPTTLTRLGQAIRRIILRTALFL